MTAAETAEKIKVLLKELPDERADAARLDELRRVFGRLVSIGDLTFASQSSGDELKMNASRKWNAFLLQRHRTMTLQLCQRIRQGRRTAIRTMWGVIATSPVPSHDGRHAHISADLLRLFLRSMSQLSGGAAAAGMDKATRTMMEGEFLHPYRDVQYYSLVAVTRLATEAYDALDKKGSTTQHEIMAEGLFQFLLMIPIPTSQKDMDASKYLFPPSGDTVGDHDQSRDSDEDVTDDDNDNDSDESSDDEEQDKGGNGSNKGQRDTSPQRLFAFQQLKAHRKALSNAWLAVLKLPLPLSELKHALQFLPHNVLPHVPNPLVFSDFLIQAFDTGGVVSIVALDGLFYLMTQHGLEYPMFYTSLYRLVAQPSLLYVKYRTRFFELLTKCLCRNEMLPAHLVAAFVKRLLRSALSAPPPGILFVLALCANLMRKHPECACLIHRGRNDESILDTFDPHTDDPTQSRAMESSLWELSALAQHYYPAVATLAKSIGTEDNQSPLHDMDLFLRHTYKSLFDQERKRGGDPSPANKKRRKVNNTPLAFVEPEGLFTKDDVFSDMLALPLNPTN